MIERIANLILRNRVNGLKPILLPILFCFFLVTGSLGEEVPPFGTVGLILFYSGRSEQSRGVLDNLISNLQKIHRMDVRLYDIDVPRNYSILIKMEEQSGKGENELPVIFIGKDVIAGEEQIIQALEPAIRKYESLGGCALPALPEIGKEEARAAGSPIHIAYFYQKGCPRCDRAASLLGYLSKQYPNLVIRKYDIETSDGKILNESLCERLKIPEAKRLAAPSVIFANDALVREEITGPALEGLIQKYGSVKGIPPWEIAEGEEGRAKTHIIERFKTFNLTAVATAGLIDGFNPCGFATLIFFISYLTMIGRKRSEIFLVGLAFSLSVFITYFLIGLGFLRLLQSVSVIPAVGRVVYGVAIGLALALGILSLYDYVLCLKGRASGMLLQMPAFLKSRVRDVIRKEVKVNRYVMAAIATGFIVSFLELGCMGQVYLPTILFVSRVEKLRVHAVAYLALYNLLFIIPLLVIFALVYFGTRSERLSWWFQQHVAQVKLATCLVFFILAGALSLSFL